LIFYISVRRKETEDAVLSFAFEGEGGIRNAGRCIFPLRLYDEIGRGNNAFQSVFSHCRQIPIGYDKAITQGHGRADSLDCPEHHTPTSICADKLLGLFLSGKRPKP